MCIPVLLNYMKTLDVYLKELDNIEKPDDLTGLTSQERILMKILKELV